MLTGHLGILEAKSLLRLARSLPELEYAFQHALVQDAAYASLLKQDRKRLHQAVGETLERVYPDQRGELAPLLAEHYYIAGDALRALEYFSLAGDRALQRFAAPEAVALYTRAIEISEVLHSPSPRLFRVRGTANETLGDFDRARNDYETALHLAQRAGDGRAEWEALLSLGLLWAGRDYTQTRHYYQHALELARATGDPGILAQSLNRVGNWHMNVEQPLEALAYHRQALSTFRELDDTHGIAQTLDLLGVTSYMASDFTHGSEYFREAIALFYQLDDRRGLASSLVPFGSRIKALSYAAVITTGELLKGTREGLHEVEQAIRFAHEVGWRAGEAYALAAKGGVLTSVGRYAPAFDSAQAGLALADSIGHRQWTTFGHFVLGALYLDLLAFSQAQRHLEIARDMAGAISSMIWMRVSAAHLALAYLEQKQTERARAVLDAVLGLDAPAETLAQRIVWYARAELALATGDGTRALVIADTLEAPPHTSAGPSQVVWYARWLRGEGLVALHRYTEAEAVLTASHDLLQELGMRPMLWRTLVLLSQAYDGQGRHAEARQAVSAARDMLRELAAEAPEELRDHLLNRATTLSAGL
jgi:tetratricopeptide (TPR) repeat protein